MVSFSFSNSIIEIQVKETIVQNNNDSDTEVCLLEEHLVSLENLLEKL